MNDPRWPRLRVEAQQRILATIEAAAPGFRNAIVDLYLNVKIRNNEEVRCALTDTNTLQADSFSS